MAIVTAGVFFPSGSRADKRTKRGYWGVVDGSWRSGRKRVKAFSFAFKYFFAWSRAKSRDHALERDRLVIMLCLPCLQDALSYLIVISALSSIKRSRYPSQSCSPTCKTHTKARTKMR